MDANQQVDPNPKRYKFDHHGHAYHLKIENVADLKLILDLDEAHWVATNAPIETINTDPVFLQLLDEDLDGRIRTTELKKGIVWLLEHLQDTSGIKPGNKVLDIEAIQLTASQGKRIQESALKILKKRESKGRSLINLLEVRDIIKKDAEGGMDTAGMVLENAAPSEEIRKFLQDIIQTVGGEPHPSGQLGVTFEKLEQFMNEIRQYQQWLLEPQAAVEIPEAPILWLGDHTPRAYEFFSEINTKIDQFFILCDAIQLEPKIAKKLRSNSSRLSLLDLTDTESLKTFLVDSPIAWPNNESVLYFEQIINPYYYDKIESFQERVVTPFTGQKMEKITHEQWKILKRKFIPYQTWYTSKPEVNVGDLSLEKISRYLDSPLMQKTIRLLIQRSHKTAFVLDNLRLVEKLILFQCYMMQFVNSFVSFPNLYNPKTRALFEMGTLIMDGRHFTLAIKVPNREQHAKFSNASNMFVLYVEVSAKEGDKLYEIAVPVTSGMRGNLQVGKRGIFQDIYGNDHHATVVQIVENPISFLEAIVAPFVRLGRAITTKLDEMSTKAEQDLEAKSASALTQVRKGLPKKKEKPSTAVTQPSAGGLLAGGSIAIAALGSSVAFITSTLAELGWQVFLGGVLAAALAVLLPTTIVAYLKLAKRDLSSILEGSGWGINTRMRLDHQQAWGFTIKPEYPANAKGIHRHHWRWLFLAALIIVIIFILFWYASKQG